MHDIGRRTGIAAMRHIIDGYDYAMSRGWDEVARVCLTHSFPIQDVDADIGKKDVTAGQYEFIRSCLNRLEYDDYDRLIILCDSLASADGFCILEKRFVDTARRYGLFRLRLHAGTKHANIKHISKPWQGCLFTRCFPALKNAWNGKFSKERQTI